MTKIEKFNSEMKWWEEGPLLVDLAEKLEVTTLVLAITVILYAFFQIKFWKSLISYSDGLVQFLLKQLSLLDDKLHIWEALSKLEAAGLKVSRYPWTFCMGRSCS